MWEHQLEAAHSQARAGKLCRNIGTGAYQTALLRHALVGEAGAYRLAIGVPY